MSRPIRTEPSPQPAALETVIRVSNRWEAVRLLRRTRSPGTFLVERGDGFGELHAAPGHEGEIADIAQTFVEHASLGHAGHDRN